MIIIPLLFRRVWSSCGCSHQMSPLIAVQWRQQLWSLVWMAPWANTVHTSPAVIGSNSLDRIYVYLSHLLCLSLAAEWAWRWPEHLSQPPSSRNHWLFHWEDLVWLWRHPFVCSPAHTNIHIMLCIVASVYYTYVNVAGIDVVRATDSRCNSQVHTVIIDCSNIHTYYRDWTTCTCFTCCIYMSYATELVKIITVPACTCV